MLDVEGRYIRRRKLGKKQKKKKIYFIVEIYYFNE